jgi:hypothetical protein
MAFESIVAYVILFSIGLSAVVGLSFFYKDYVVRTTTSLDTRQEMLKDKEDSAITIDFIDYQPSFPRNFVLTSQQEFAEGIFEKTNETAVPGDLLLDFTGPVYNESGNWTSPIYDEGTPINFTSFSMAGGFPPQCWLGFQIRSADSAPNLIGDFIGPDGTENTYYLPSQGPISDWHDGDEVYQLRIYLSTSDTALTPVLSELNITYNFVLNTFSMDVVNDGKVRIDMSTLDIYVDESRLSRTFPNMEKMIMLNTDVQNPGLWDPGETMKVQFPFDLNTSENHIFRMVTEYGSSDYFTYIS